MPMDAIEQPSILVIDEDLRLVKYEGNYEFALEWYQDETLVKMVDNTTDVYTMEKLNRMYTYLDKVGELFFIEYNFNGKWIPVGDVTLCSNGDMPIVIVSEYQKKGIGRRVIQTLIGRAKTLKLGYSEVKIYKFNTVSQKLFTSLGFVRTGVTETEFIYRLEYI